jgi:hypothetical protein
VFEVVGMSIEGKVLIVICHRILEIWLEQF